MYAGCPPSCGTLLPVSMRWIRVRHHLEALRDVTAASRDQMAFDPAALNWQYVPGAKKFTTAPLPDWGSIGLRAQPNPGSRDFYALTKERGRLILIRTRGDKSWTLGKFTGFLGDAPIQVLLSELREQITSQIERRELALVRLLTHLDGRGMGWAEHGERLVPLTGDVLGMNVLGVSLMPSPQIKDHWEILGEA